MRSSKEKAGFPGLAVDRALTAGLSVRIATPIAFLQISRFKTTFFGAQPLGGPGGP